MTMRSLPDRVITSRSASRIQVLRVGLNFAAAHRFRSSMRGSESQRRRPFCPANHTEKIIDLAQRGIRDGANAAVHDLSEFDPEHA
jgi:hypothetical protein